MEDEKIIALYWQRDQSAIDETDRKYGVQLRGLSYGILSDREDAEECVSDTYMAVWNSLPPQRPMGSGRANGVISNSGCACKKSSVTASFSSGSTVQVEYTSTPPGRTYSHTLSNIARWIPGSRPNSLGSL